MKVNKVLFTLLVGLLASTLSVEGWAFGRIGDYVKDYVKDFYGGSKDMWNNYK